MLWALKVQYESIQCYFYVVPPRNKTFTSRFFFSQPFHDLSIENFNLFICRRPRSLKMSSTPNGSDYDDDDAASGRSGVFFTEKPHNFSLLASPIARRRRSIDDGTLNTTLASTSTLAICDVKLTSHFSHFEEQPGISRLISPEKESGASIPSVPPKTNATDNSSANLRRCVEDLIERVAKLEMIVHRLENEKQKHHPREDDECGSGISSVSDDFPPTEEQVKASKRTPRGFFRFRRTRGRPGNKTRVEV